MNVWQGAGRKNTDSQVQRQNDNRSLGQVLDSAFAVVTNSQEEREGLIKGALRGK